MKKFIISESQEKELKRLLNEEAYQMPVDKKANKPFCINPEKVLIVKKFLDKRFKSHDYEKIGASGMPIKIKIISMNASNGEPLKYMHKDQLHDLLIDRFQNMFTDAVERSAFLLQVIEDWLSKKIGIFGTLSTNRILAENITIEEIDNIAKETDTNPTEGQKEAGNYKMGHVRIKGFPISIENAKGSIRSYKNGDKEGKIKMANHYGYFTNTSGNGKDGDAVDVFIGPDVDRCENIYVIDQNNEKGEFDESKVMLGFLSSEDAKKAYLNNFSSDWKGFREITSVSINVFKKWLYRKHKQCKPFAEYVYIQRKRIHEGILLNEEEYNEIHKIATLFDEKAAEEVAEEIKSHDVDAYVIGNTIYIVMEQDKDDPKYVDDVIMHCKEIAYEYTITHNRREEVEILREELIKNKGR